MKGNIDTFIHKIVYKINPSLDILVKNITMFCIGMRVRH